LNVVVGVNVSASDVEAVVLFHIDRSGEVDVIVATVVHHRETTQLHIVHQELFIATLYSTPLSTVIFCVSVAVQEECTAPVDHVVHPAQTVRHVSEVSAGVVTNSAVTSTSHSLISVRSHVNTSTVVAHIHIFLVHIFIAL